MVKSYESRKDIGRMINDMRKANGWTVKELSEKSGVGCNNIVAIQEGKYAVNVDILSRVLAAFGCAISAKKIKIEDQ